MAETLKTALRHLATFASPGLILLLLAVQVVFGLRGFDHPHGNLLVVLQAPGLLLGWGAVALLLPLLIWMVLDWWGYGLSGFVLKGLGSAVLGISLAGLLGMEGGPASGGLVGGALGQTLKAALGTGLAITLLLLMAVPALVLATAVALVTTSPARLAADARKRLDAGPVRAAREAHASGARALPVHDTTSRSASKERAPAARAAARPEEDTQGGWRRLFKSRRHPMLGSGPLGEKEARAWYPQRRFDADGNELPMQFGRDRDVGGIRYLGDDEVEGTASAAESDVNSDDASDAVVSDPESASEGANGDDAQGAAPHDGDAMPTVAELFARHRRAPEAEAADPVEGAVHVDSEGRVVSVARPVPPAPPAPAKARPSPVAPAAARTESSEGSARHAGRNGAQGKAQSGARLGPAYIPSALRDAGTDGVDPALPTGVRWKPAEPRAEAAAVRAPVPAEPTTAPPSAPHAPVAASPPPAAAAASPPTEHKPAAAARAAAERSPARAHVSPQPRKAQLPAPPPTARDSAAGEESQEISVDQRVEDALRGPPRVPGTHEAPRSVREPLRQALEAAQQPDSERRYLKKLDACGIIAPSDTRSQGPTARGAAQPQVLGEDGATRAGASGGPPAAATPAADGAAQRRLATLRDGAEALRREPPLLRAMEVTLERGAASAVLLSRRLGVGFPAARELVERLVGLGLLSTAGPTGAHEPTLNAEEWAELGL